MGAGSSSSSSGCPSPSEEEDEEVGVVAAAAAVPDCGSGGSIVYVPVSQIRSEPVDAEAVSMR